MYSGKDLAELSGYTSRVYSLLSSLHCIDNSIYPKVDRGESRDAEEVRHIGVRELTAQPSYDMASVAGRISVGHDHLLIESIPIVAPPSGSAGLARGGEELIRSLDLRVEKGEHTLITGPKYVTALSFADMAAVLERQRSLESLQSFGPSGLDLLKSHTLERAVSFTCHKDHTSASVHSAISQCTYTMYGVTC